MKTLLALLLLCPAAPALAGKYEALLPPYIPAGRPGLDDLTALLRAKSLPPELGEELSAAALLLLPRDRSGAGVLSFAISAGPRAGLYQCEALGRGETARSPREGWTAGSIAGTAVWYAPQQSPGGATIPGLYDLDNISPEEYELFYLGKSEEARKLNKKAKKKAKKLRGGPARFSAVYHHWYPKDSRAVPVDMKWSAAQAGGPGEGLPVSERPSGELSEEAARLRAKQLAADPGYYRGPYGRYGFAVHTDSWEDLKKLRDEKNAGRPEMTDFRWRDTSGCVKLRPACLELLNEFVAGQKAAGRPARLRVEEAPELDGLPPEDPAAPRLPEYGVGAGGEGGR